MTKLLKFLAVFLLGAVSARAEIVTERVTYRDGDTELEGVRAYDPALVGKRPGVLVIHEWWGVNDYVERRAQEYAEQGYVAFAPDLYGKGQRAASAEQAKKLSAPFYQDRNLFRRRTQAGLGVLVKDPLVDYEKLGVVGYCFGGTAALELARSGVDLEGVVVLHGGLSNPTPVDTKDIKGAVLALIGADDPLIPQAERETSKKEMKEANIKLEYVEYPGAVHAFSNPAAGSSGASGVAYNKAADVDSFKRSKEFLAQVFGKTS